MNSGQEFVKKIRPLGCVLFLGLGILLTISLFTIKGSPVKGYSAPHDTDYYEEHTDELITELEENLFPLIEVAPECYEKDGKIYISDESLYINRAKSAVMYYYGDKLFVFTELP